MPEATVASMAARTTKVVLNCIVERNVERVDVEWVEKREKREDWK